MIKFSIIIPCYNAEPYIYELLDCLGKQITDEVEVILIDDASKIPIRYDYEWCQIFRQSVNKGVSAARNRGLNVARGEAIGFIDADDLVSDNYVSFVLNALKTKEWDYIDLSWKSLEDNRYVHKLKSDNDNLPNPSACTRVFKKEFIGDNRFPEYKDAAEDEHFTRHLDLKSGKHICATEFMYFYRLDVPQSKTKNYMSDKLLTKRIAYYYKNVTKNMTNLIDEIKKEDEKNEVFLLTFRNDIPELEKYCQVICPPRQIRVMESRGEQNNYVKEIPRTKKTQVVIYKSHINKIGGIETFIYSFCKQMSKYYDITVMYDSIDMDQLVKLMEYTPVVKNDIKSQVICDTLILNSILDKYPNNIVCKQSIQMVHCVKQANYTIPTKANHIVNVSQASKDSFGDEAKDGIVIHNLTDGAKIKKALLLVSALRVGANDKQGNDERCIKFSKMLDNAKINYIWLYFGDKPMKNEPENMVYCGLKDDIRPFVTKADYLVQLSGAEAFSYSLLESLECRTPVIVTPLAQNEDMGIVDGQNGYIVPFEVDGFNVKKILKVPKFNYIHPNGIIIEQWRRLLGHTVPTRSYKPSMNKETEIIKEYYDIQLKETLGVGTRRKMPLKRAMELQEKGFVRIL